MAWNARYEVALMEDFVPTRKAINLLIPKRLVVTRRKMCWVLFRRQELFVERVKLQNVLLANRQAMNQSAEQQLSMWRGFEGKRFIIQVSHDNDE
jgi:hypothetical protein